MAADPPLPPGVYEQVVSAHVATILASIPDKLVNTAQIHPAEVGTRIAWHVARELETLLRQTPDATRIAIASEVVTAVARALQEVIPAARTAPLILTTQPTTLRAIGTPLPDGQPRFPEPPLISVLDTTLLTNAPGEPRVGHQISAEIESADRIDVLMAFIRITGIRPLADRLRRHLDAGRPLRILTTTYTGTTEAAALDLLSDLGADVRISYTTESTRLHAKAWLFERRTGFSTAYIGSSNLTHAAMVPGLEWNLRVSGARNPDVIAKFRATFDTYWNSEEFRPYDRAEFIEQTSVAAARASGPHVFLSPLQITPRPFQERLLDLLAVARAENRHRNLLVAATGTGKTVMAALDYTRLAQKLPRQRLLFVAHRQEILDQAHATFRHVLGDANFGEQWVGGHRPRHFEHVFASIQSLSQINLEDLDRNHFDVVIMDEFHHAAAATYRRLLDHVQPIELLGLTATPERTDGASILEWFDDRITAELRLWDAIEQQHLCPFIYFGIHDGTDLRGVPWRRGRGYDTSALANLYTADDVWAQLVIREVRRHIADPSGMRALGFCVDVAHAEFMARSFARSGIASVAVSAATPSAERQQALNDLRAGRINAVFSVDLFNEGVDLPNVNTLLFLRPTQSPTLFLQQLGRGLRRQQGKAACTVLDFVGQQHREFRFDRTWRALLGGTRRELQEAVSTGFPYLPAGCEIHLDRRSSEIILDSIRNALPSTTVARASELRAHCTAGHPATLTSFLQHSGIDLEDIYASGRSWSDLCEAAGVDTKPVGPHETELRRAIGRLLHVDDRPRLVAYRSFLRTPLDGRDEAVTAADLSQRERRLLRMLLSQLLTQAPKNALANDAPLDEGVALLARHPQVCAEIDQLIEVLLDRLDHLHIALDENELVPLQVHARYTRLEILAAFGHQSENRARTAAWQTGVFWLPDVPADLLAFTLDKTDGNFSPTTRYRDYAISPELIHWESQGTTRADSATGLRYQHHAQQGSKVLLFARLRSTDRAFWFLGPASYVSHEGELPMAITWRLQHRLPSDLFHSFAAAVA